MNVKHLSGFRLSQIIQDKKEQVEAAAPDLLEAIQYYFDVLDEVRGPFFMDKPDHVLTKMIEAYAKATGQQEPKPGRVIIRGYDKADGFVRYCEESELSEVANEIFAEYPGEDGYYNFTKFLWVEYPDGRPERLLHSVVG